MARHFPESLTANFAFSFDVVIQTTTSLSANSFTASLRGPATQDFTGTSSAANPNLITFAGSLTVAGKYRYSIYSTDSNAIKTLIETGDVIVAVDPTSIATDSNLTTYAERVLSSLQAHMEGRVLSATENYSIAGRTISKLTMPEVEKLIDIYTLKVKNQNKKLPRAVLAVFRNR